MNKIEALERLAKMRESGIIDDDEYKKIKAQVISSQSETFDNFDFVDDSTQTDSSSKCSSESSSPVSASPDTNSNKKYDMGVLDKIDQMRAHPKDKAPSQTSNDHTGMSKIEALEYLVNMRDSGVISEDVYNELKESIIPSSQNPSQSNSDKSSANPSEQYSYGCKLRDFVKIFLLFMLIPVACLIVSKISDYNNPILQKHRDNLEDLKSSIAATTTTPYASSYSFPSSSSSSSSGATVSQLQAVKLALSYLRSSAFSRQGLIEQLEYEGFSNADAVYGVDHSGANWYTQAEKLAEMYLRSGSFSRKRLIEQLEYEGFTYTQAVHGVDSVGL